MSPLDVFCRAPRVGLQPDLQQEDPNIKKKKRKKIDTNGDGDICQRENARGGRMLFEECGDDRD